MKMKWLDEMPDQFVASNGVKEGAVQSPVLFCIYLDGLFIKLNKSPGNIFRKISTD